MALGYVPVDSADGGATDGGIACKGSPVAFPS